MVIETIAVIKKIVIVILVIFLVILPLPLVFLFILLAIVIAIAIAIAILLAVVLALISSVSCPARNGNRMTDYPSGGNKMSNAFLDRSRWVQPLHKNIPECGQHFCHSSPNQFLQGRYDV